MTPDPKKTSSKPDLPKCRVTGCLKKGIFENGICSKCQVRLQKGIKRESDKRAFENKEYLKIRKQFLKDNPICAVTGEKAKEIHHQKGRIGKLLTDVRYFLPVSRKAHQLIENNPEWSYKNGYSLKRTT